MSSRALAFTRRCSAASLVVTLLLRCHAKPPMLQHLRRGWPLKAAARATSSCVARGCTSGNIRGSRLRHIRRTAVVSRRLSLTARGTAHTETATFPHAIAATSAATPAVGVISAATTGVIATSAAVSTAATAVIPVPAAVALRATPAAVGAAPARPAVALPAPGARTTVSASAAGVAVLAAAAPVAVPVAAAAVAPKPVARGAAAAAVSQATVVAAAASLATVPAALVASSTAEAFGRFCLFTTPLSLVYDSSYLGGFHCRAAAVARVASAHLLVSTRSFSVLCAPKYAEEGATRRTHTATIPDGTTVSAGSQKEREGVIHIGEITFFGVPPGVTAKQSASFSAAGATALGKKSVHRLAGQIVAEDSDTVDRRMLHMSGLKGGGGSGRGVGGGDENNSTGKTVATLQVPRYRQGESEYTEGAPAAAAGSKVAVPPTTKASTNDTTESKSVVAGDGGQRGGRGGGGRVTIAAGDAENGGKEEENGVITMSYVECVKRLYTTRLPGPKGIDLERVRAVAVSLGSPHEQYDVIHVAGTNGKGSTCAKLGACLSLKVIETGLGGRLDATNIVPAPRCTVIVSVGWDHTDTLGSTLEQIAEEKAGIIKPKVPVVLGPTAAEYRAFANKADKFGCEVWEVKAEPRGEDFTDENARIARAVVEHVLQLDLLPNRLEAALSVQLPLRAQVLTKADLQHATALCGVAGPGGLAPAAAFSSSSAAAVSTTTTTTATATALKDDGRQGEGQPHVAGRGGNHASTPTETPNSRERAVSPSPPLIEYETPHAVIVDVGHNVTALNRLLQFVQHHFYDCPVRAVIALSKGRHTSTLQPFINHLHFPNRSRLQGLHIAEPAHPRAKRLVEWLEEIQTSDDISAALRNAIMAGLAEQHESLLQQQEARRSTAGASFEQQQEQQQGLATLNMSGGGQQRGKYALTRQHARVSPALQRFQNYIDTCGAGALPDILRFAYRAAAAEHSVLLIAGTFFMTREVVETLGFLQETPCCDNMGKKYYYDT